MKCLREHNHKNVIWWTTSTYNAVKHTTKIIVGEKHYISKYRAWYRSWPHLAGIQRVKIANVTFIAEVGKFHIKIHYFSVLSTFQTWNIFQDDYHMKKRNKISKQITNSRIRVDIQHKYRFPTVTLFSVLKNFLINLF